MFQRYLPAFYLLCVTLNVFSSNNEVTKYDSSNHVVYSQVQDDNSTFTCSKIQTQADTSYNCSCSSSDSNAIKRVWGGSLCSINHKSNFDRLKKIYLAQQAKKKESEEKKS